MKTLVIGCGSIGTRHAKILTSLGHRVAFVSARSVDGFDYYHTIQGALSNEKPDYVIIANRTNAHYQSLQELLESGYESNILVEKPLFHANLELVGYDLAKTYVAYNLRFHPVILRLRQILEKETVLSVQVYVGQYLPQWRPSVDYKQSYSARREEGGGVLRDLSHELDYINWIFGEWKRVVTLGGHFSHLEINSDDIFSAMMVMEKCPIVSVQMNYLDRVARRRILVNTDKHTIEADLISGTIQIDDKVESFLVSRNHTYELQHKALLSSDRQLVCTYEQGIAVNRLIAAMERSIVDKRWITNE